MQLDYGMVDADNHYYEPTDALTRYLPDERRRDVYWVSEVDTGRKRLVIGSRVWEYLANPTFDPIVKPGLLDRRNTEPITNRPEYRDPAKRVARFDEQGIDRSLMFPTLMNGLGEIVGTNLSLHVDLVWSFNQWLADDWGFNYKNRIFSAPLFALTDPQQSVEMLEWALDRGARAILVAAGPIRSEIGWRSPADPVYDPFWARLAEAKVPACVHAAAQYNRHSGEYTGHFELRPMEDQTLDADHEQRPGRVRLLRRHGVAGGVYPPPRPALRVHREQVGLGPQPGVAAAGVPGEALRGPELHPVQHRPLQDHGGPRRGLPPLRVTSPRTGTRTSRRSSSSNRSSGSRPAPTTRTTTDSSNPATTPNTSTG